MQEKLKRYHTVPLVAFVGLDEVPKEFLKINGNAKCYKLHEFETVKKSLENEHLKVIGDISQIFDYFDVDGNGFVDKVELRNVVKTLNSEINLTEIQL
jgi:Ca2+-binding EF-hand superfamily protein